MNKFYTLIFLAQLIGFSALAQTKTITITENVDAAPKANYQLAAKFSPSKIKKMVFSTKVDAHWLKLSHRFWYEYESPSGKQWYIVDPVAKTKRTLFDLDQLASEITLVIHDPFDAQHLPIEKLKFSKDEKSVTFQIKSSIDELKPDRKDKKAADSLQKKIFSFNYDLASQKLVADENFHQKKDKTKWASVAPDSSAILFSRNYNLYWMDKENYQKALKKEDDSTIVEHQLTKDGVKYYSYGSRDNGYGEDNEEYIKNQKKRRPVAAFWSADAKHFVIDRTDERKVKDLWVINSTGKGRPTLETYKYQMPGEKEAPEEELVLFDFPAKTYKTIHPSAYKDQTLTLFRKEELNKNRDDDFHPTIWLGDNQKFYFSRTSRDMKRIDICSYDINSSEVKAIIPERFNTFVENLNYNGLQEREPILINGGKEIIHWSERNGWGHFYLFDGNGNLKNQITKGAFHCDDMVKVDEKKRVLYFTANGREPNEDPYYLHLYSINFDGSGMKLLDKGDFDHDVNMDDENQFFIDNYSRVNTAPKAVLYDQLGNKVMDLEETDLSLLMQAGYHFPEPFKVKADDGITDIYGVMYKPFDFDPNKKYPLIEYVYPGPQTEAVNTSFNTNMNRVDRLAQFGYIVISVGNRGGSPARSTWYHNYGYSNLRDYGLADKKAAAEQLADRFKYIDINKVGITGHSGGGFMSTAAMLVYPDFFKVAVSESGNHDNSIYNRWWSERHHGVKEVISDKGDTTFKYSIDKNPDLAKNLKGYLMLMTGDRDNNVHPANTIRVANALIKAGKRFDFVLVPGQRHGYGDMTEYMFWRLADYFNNYLIGDFSGSSKVDILEMDKEIPQNGKDEE